MYVIWFTLAWLLGLVAGQQLTQPRWLLCGLMAVVGSGLTLWLWRDRTLRLGGAVLLGLALGTARFWVSLPHWQDPTFTAHYNDQYAPDTHDLYHITIEGTVVGEPDIRDLHTNLRVLPDTLYISETQTLQQIQSGVVLARASNYPAIALGDRVRLVGQLTTPPQLADFNYTEYLAQQRVYSQISGRAELLQAVAKQYPTIWQVGAELQSCPQRLPNSNWLTCSVHVLQRWLWAFKQPLLTAVIITLNEPQAAYLQAILLGARASLPASLNTAFRLTGTTHLISISGFHIAVIAGVILTILEKILHKNAARPIALVVIAIYVLLVGAPPPAIRAGLMAGAVIVTGSTGNLRGGLLTLALATLLMTGFEPNYLWMIGFQLSAVSTLGLMLYAKPFQSGLKSLFARRTNRLATFFDSWIGSVLAMTAAAQMATLPLILYYFGEFSISSVLANIMISPAQPPALILGAISTIAGYVYPALGQTLAWSSWLFLAYTLNIIQLLAKLPGGAIYLGQLALPMVLLYYIILGGLTWMHHQLPEQRPVWYQWLLRHRLTPLIAAALGLLLVIGIYTWQHRPDGKLHVTFLAVGSGSACLIRTPSGQYIVIDGGSSPNRLAQQLGARIPFGNRRIEYLIATAADSDVLTGLAGVLKRYQPQQAYYLFDPSTLTFPNNRTYSDWLEQLNAENIPAEWVQASTVLETSDGVRLRLLPLANGGGAVRVEYGQSQMLLAHSVRAADAETLVDQSAHVLLVPQAAAPDSFSAEFWAATQPEIAVVSVAAGNLQNAPAPAQLRLLNQTHWFRTDRSGWVDIATNGQQLWSATER